MQIYYDRFLEDYVTEKDSYAAPERYWEALCSGGDNYVETYLMNNGKNLTISYSKSEFITGYYEILKKQLEEKEGCKIAYRISVALPKDIYGKLEKYMENK